MTNLKTKVLLLTVVSIIAIAFVVNLQAEQSKVGEKKGQVSLHKNMESMAKSFRQLRRTVKKPTENKATLKTLVQMQTLMFQSKTLIPKQVEKLPDAKKMEMLKVYRLKMIAMLKALLDVEKAVLESKNDQAYEIVKKLGVIRNEGHDVLGVD